MASATGRRRATHAGLFDVKADLLAALEAITGAPMTAPITQGGPAWYHPGRSGTIALGPKVIAQFGELHPKLLAAFDLKVPAAGFEIFLDAIPDAKSKGKAKPLFAPSPYQAIERDFAFVVDAKLAAGDLVKAVKLADRDLIDSVTLFDVYEGKGVRRRQEIPGPGRAHPAQGRHADRCRDRSPGPEDRGRGPEAGRDAALLSLHHGQVLEPAMVVRVSSFGAAPISAASFSNSALARGLERWWRSAKMHLVLLGVLEAGEFGHPHLVAMRFQIQPAQHIGQMRAEFAAVDADGATSWSSAPFAPSSCCATSAWQQGTSATNFASCFSANRMASSVAVSQACSAVTISTAPDCAVGDLAFDKFHAVKAAFRRDLLGPWRSDRRALPPDDPAAPGRREIQVVENKAQIGFARAQIGQHRLVFFRQRRINRRLDQLRQMLHLFQLAPRIRIQPAIVGQDMQRLEQRHRLARPQIGNGICRFCGFTCTNPNAWPMP